MCPIIIIIVIIQKYNYGIMHDSERAVCGRDAYWNNQVLISGIITWQVLGRQNEGTTYISDGEITQNQLVLSSTTGI